ncbi:SHOCT domain-containing protein [Leucobacter sp. HY1908]
MGIMQELTGQGKVIAGHLSNGSVTAARHGLVVQSIVTRQKVNSETVLSWEEIVPEPGMVGKFGASAIGNVLPGALGKSLQAAVGASAQTGHTVHVEWANGKSSVLELPNKLYMVLSTLLKERELRQEPVAQPHSPEDESPALVERVLDKAADLFQKGRPADDPDLVTLLSRLAELRESGVLSEKEFAAKKAELLSKL